MTDKDLMFSFYSVLPFGELDVVIDCKQLKTV